MERKQAKRKALIKAAEEVVFDRWKTLVPLLDKLGVAIHNIKNQNDETPKFTTADFTRARFILQQFILACPFSCFDINKTCRPYLYEHYKNWLFDYVGKQVIPRIEKKSGMLQVFDELVLQWKTQKTLAATLSRILQYEFADGISSVALGGVEYKSVEIIALIIFRDIVCDGYFSEVTTTIGTVFAMERKGQYADRSGLKNVIEMFIGMGIGCEDYDDRLIFYRQVEATILTRTTSHYQNERNQQPALICLDDYLQKVEKKIVEEEERAAYYLHPTSKKKLSDIVVTEMLKVDLMELLEMPQSGFIALIRQYSIDPLNQTSVKQLEQMFRMFKQIENNDGIRPMQQLFCQELDLQGRAILSDCLQKSNFDQTELIERLLEMRSKYLALIQTAFEQNNLFYNAMKTAFEAFSNEIIRVDDKSLLVAKVLAQFIDNVMRGGGKNIHQTEESLDELFSNVVGYLSFIRDKDFFGECYRSLLARRLLERVMKEEDEKTMIQKMKMAFGIGMTQKMENIVMDRKLSGEIMEKYEKWLVERNIHSSIQFSALVLTTGSWPIMHVDILYPPDTIANCMDSFKTFYFSSSHDRTLNWIHSSSTAIVTGFFDRGRREMSMTAYQASICMLFNTFDTLTLPEIYEKTGICRDETKRALMGLIAGKHKILTLADKSNAKNVENTDIITFNSSFNSNQTKLKIPLPNLVVKQTSSGLSENTIEERGYAIDAAIVRVLKTRKTIEHNDLLVEVIAQLKMFRPEVKIIKQRIESLVDREFLERDSKNPRVYLLNTWLDFFRTHRKAASKKKTMCLHSCNAATTKGWSYKYRYDYKCKRHFRLGIVYLLPIKYKHV